MRALLVSLGLAVSGVAAAQPALTPAEVKQLRNGGYRNATLVYATPKLRIASATRARAPRLVGDGESAITDEVIEEVLPQCPGWKAAALRQAATGLAATLRYQRIRSLRP